MNMFKNLFLKLQFHNTAMISSLVLFLVRTVRLHEYLFDFFLVAKIVIQKGRLKPDRGLARCGLVFTLW